MQWMTEQGGYKMSTTVLKDELTDIQEVVMVYSPTDNAVSLTNCFIGEVKFFLFYLVITFIFSSRANSLKGLYKNFLKL